MVPGLLLLTTAVSTNEIMGELPTDAKMKATTTSTRSHRYDGFTLAAILCGLKPYNYGTYNYRVYRVSSWPGDSPQ
jgi:hypothetical protein